MGKIPISRFSELSNHWRGCQMIFIGFLLLFSRIYYDTELHSGITVFFCDADYKSTCQIFGMHNAIGKDARWFSLVFCNVLKNICLQNHIWGLECISVMQEDKSTCQTLDILTASQKGFKLSGRCNIIESETKSEILPTSPNCALRTLYAPLYAHICCRCYARLKTKCCTEIA